MPREPPHPFAPHSRLRTAVLFALPLSVPLEVVAAYTDGGVVVRAHGTVLDRTEGNGSQDPCSPAHLTCPRTLEIDFCLLCLLVCKEVYVGLGGVHAELTWKVAGCPGPKFSVQRVGSLPSSTCPHSPCQTPACLHFPSPPARRFFPDARSGRRPKAGIRL